VFQTDIHVKKIRKKSEGTSPQKGDGHNDDPPKPPIKEESGESNGGDVVRVTGNELGEGLSIQQLRDAAKQYARKNFAGKNVTVDSNGVEIMVPMKGVKHTLSFAKTSEDIQAVVAIPRLLRCSVKVKEEADHRKRHNVKFIEKYHAKLEIDGIPYVAEMVVTVAEGRSRKFNDARFFYNQHIKRTDQP